MSLWEHIGSVPLTEGRRKIVRSGSTPRGIKQGEGFARRSRIPTSSSFQGASRATIGVIVLALAAVLVFSAATAHAQTTAVCSNTPGADQRIECIEDDTSTADIDIDVQDLTITTTDDEAHAIYGDHQGAGDIGHLRGRHAGGGFVRSEQGRAYGRGCPARFQGDRR